MSRFSRCAGLLVPVFFCLLKARFLPVFHCVVLSRFALVSLPIVLSVGLRATSVTFQLCLRDVSQVMNKVVIQ